MTASSYASDAKITEALAVLGADLIGQTEQTLLQQLVVAAALGGGGGGGGAATWGTITGTLSAQTDLQAALDAKLPLAGGTLTGQLIQATNGAASTPPLLLSGTIFTGGTSTTTKPQLLVEPSGTTSTGWSTNGTGLGVNAPSGFTGNLLDLQLNSSNRFRVGADGKVTLLAQGYPAASISSTTNANYGIGFNGGLVNFIANNEEAGAACLGNVSGTNRPYLGATALMVSGFGSAPSGSGVSGCVILTNLAANELTLGYTHATTTTHQTFKAHNVTTGTGADLILQGGTGSVADGSVKIGTAAGGLAFFGASGTTLIAGNTTIGYTAAGLGNAVLDDTTFNGGAGGGEYTIQGLVASLKAYGILA